MSRSNILGCSAATWCGRALPRRRAWPPAKELKPIRFVPRSNLYLSFSVQSNEGVVELHDMLGGFGEAQERFTDIEWVYPQIEQLYEEVRKKAGRKLLSCRRVRRGPRPGGCGDPRP